MGISSNFGFNKTPVFTVNHISEYLTTDGAPQRTKVIRAAKFPKKIEISAYSQIRQTLKAALSKPSFDQPAVLELAERMAARARRETGNAKDEALRCERAVRAFIETIRPSSFRGMQIAPAPTSLAFSQNGVRLKVTLDAMISAEVGDVSNSGGVVLLYAFAADRGSMKARLSAITGMMLWALEGGQMEPLPRLCMAVDLAAGEIVKASAAHSRFRAKVSESCLEIAARWDSIEPPDDYDGPDWH
ncbi:hypothetical protein [Niveispirillum sp.]|uniref:hypothetical protein n=1 Tax=Niveispirillum sp. TaxID=1917217 RepID=UPI001B7CA9B9|nr:hypothetical protein [Niveispirillum sp.]MBP7334382.1 hypothetical protein [Niveispirillum sp.]